jgi:glucosamine kinase
MSARVHVGIDGGGTRARAVVLDGTGAELARAAGPAGIVRADDPAAAAEVVAELTRRVLEAAGASPVRVILALEPVAADIIVVGDAEALMEDAFGDGAGVLVIAGTGSIAWARASDGTQHRVGGWGQIMGDEGSGYGIGCAALRAIARAADGRGHETLLFDAIREQTGATRPDDLIGWAARATKAGIAALAPPVLECAGSGDVVAARIRDDAVDELALLASSAVRRADLARPRLALAGGLIGTHGPLRPALTARLLAAFDVHEILDRELDGARGAARIAMAMR